MQPSPASWWRWALVLLVPPLFALPLWAGMGRIDALFMLPALGAALAAAPSASWRPGLVAAMLVALLGLAFQSALGTRFDVVQPLLVGLAALVALAIQRALGRVGAARWRRPLRLVLALVWLIAAARLLAVAYAPPVAPAAPPRVTLVTGLPLAWGSRAVTLVAILGDDARAAPITRRLDLGFRLSFADALDDNVLADTDVLLLAQPRVLDPESLVAIDGWVRRGGRALVLVDASLHWPPPFAFGDPRNPPPMVTIAPLLRRWGIALAPVAERVPDIRRIDVDGHRLRLVGTSAIVAPGCRRDWDARRARCRIGAGEVEVIADADWLNDALWALDGGVGGDELLTAANPLWLDAELRRLAGVPSAQRAITPVWRR